MKIEPIILEGNFVRLESLSMNHLKGLAEVAFEESIWKWNPSVISNEKDLRHYIETAFTDKEKGIALPFATIEKSSHKVIGSTRFGNIDVKNRRVEIGWTWIHPNWQRSAINTEAKFLMLRHAFETWKCIRVELKTDVLNDKSRNAILRIGAKQEGILRQHVICDSGRIRDTIYFSILDSEWQEVKSNLLTKMA
jgi:N-acetyltransferase